MENAKKPRYSIDEIRQKVIPVAKKYGIKRLSLFGSYARGEADSESDVDFLIDSGHLRGMINYFSFVFALEDKLKCHVDVVMDGSSDKEFLAKIKNDEVLIYEEEEGYEWHRTPENDWILR